jgi:hypothetical protein
MNVGFLITKLIFLNFKVVSKLVAKVMGIVLQTNGVTKANVKILVLISELAVKAHSVQCQITMHCVLVLLAWLEIQELNVYEMLMSAYQTHVVLMPGKSYFFKCEILYLLREKKIYVEGRILFFNSI